MKIGIFELISDDATRSYRRMPFDFFVTKQSASIMPQAVSVWCRQQGHDVHYAVYYGQKDPLKLIPNDLDVIFFSCFSRGSGLAYALARALKFQTPNIVTILGGPHAKQFSHDALRFFDIVIQECDYQLIKEILSDLPKGMIISSHRQLKDTPSIEERLPEIKTASFWNKRPSRFSFIPILSSIGCPYSCDFCVDWNNTYTPLPLDRVKADLNFVAQNYPNIRINFYDPNFGVNFEKVMQVIESIDHPKDRWFLTEGSLNSLTKKRVKRMKEAGCMCVIPGIESWNSYSNKAGIGKTQSPSKKLDKILSRFDMIHQYIPMIQANLMFGLDTDKGDEPVELNKQFISQTPYVSHTLNIPAPFGETPMFDKYQADGRILKSLPFAFYYKPYLATTIKHYHPIEFYEKFIDTFTHMARISLQIQAVKTSKSWMFKGYHPIRSIILRSIAKTMQQILKQLKTDTAFRQFHEGKSTVLPEYYHFLYEQRLGPYKDLLKRKERLPFFNPSHPDQQTLKPTGT